MKNQYICDIGDYGKYSLLRAFAKAGIKIGVNWYLTADDGSTDGKYTDYLEQDKLRRYDPDVFTELRLIFHKKSRSVLDIEKNSVVPSAVFYSKPIPIKGTPGERAEQRVKWFEESMTMLADAELIFMDPDNGLLENGDAGKLGAEKFVYPEEVQKCFEAGKNVVYYCHRGRRKLNDWFDYKSFMFERVPEAKPIVLTYHRGTQRSYIFLIHQEDYIRYKNIAYSFADRWRPLFNEEYTNLGDVAGNTDESFDVTRSDGSTVTISKRADGWISIVDSRTPNQSSAYSPDDFCWALLR